MKNKSLKMAPYMFISPYIISFGLFCIFPIIHMVIMSFQRIEGISVTRYIGLDNYIRLLGDKHIGAAVANSVMFTIGIVVVNLLLAIVLAVILNSKITPFRNMYRSALYLPALTSIIVAGIFFRLFFGSNPQTPLNLLMKAFGLPDRAWLYDTEMSGIFALVVTSTWRWLGTNIIYFICALQTIPVELYEAADIDSAGPLQKFRYITLPSIKPILIFVVTILTYGGLRMFAESYVLWASGSGATPGDIGITIVLYIYRTAFKQFDMGYASAISVALFVVLILINLLYVKFLGIGKRVDES